MEVDQSTFWNFAWKLYTAQGVAKHCLALQEGAYRFNVNMLILACYTGQQKRRMDVQTWDALIKAIAKWQDEMMQPLRSLRRLSKGSDEQLYDQLKSAELCGERIEQGILLKALRELYVADQGTVIDNLRSLAKAQEMVIDVKPNEDIEDHFNALVMLTVQ